MESSPSERHSPSWRGPLIHFSIVESIDRTNGVLRRWNVFSSGKRSTLVRHLKGKWLWDNLNMEEARIFWLLPEILKDPVFAALLRAYANGVSKKILRERLETCPIQINFVTRQQYLSRKGRLNLILTKETISLRKTPKYSGYTKHYKDKGSLGSAREYNVLTEVLDTSSNVNEDLLYTWFTVGEFSLFSGDVILRPDETQKGRNSENINEFETYERIILEDFDRLLDE